MIVSFSWTIEALLRHEKTVTRRYWKDSHAAKFYSGRIVEAWDKSPRTGGRKRATIRIIDVRKEPLQRLLDDPEYAAAEMAKEGNLWWGSVEDFIGLWCDDFDPSDAPYRVEFEVINIIR